MKEKAIEQYLVKEVTRAGGLCLKLFSPGMNGMPDRIILMPGGRLLFCELKAPGKSPRPLQLHRHEQLRSLGFEVCVVDSPLSARILMLVLTTTGRVGSFDLSSLFSALTRESSSRFEALRSSHRVPAPNTEPSDITQEARPRAEAPCQVCRRSDPDTEAPDISDEALSRIEVLTPSRRQRRP